MKKIAMVFSGITFVLGYITLTAAVVVKEILPRILHVYLTANAGSFGHDIFALDLMGVFILGALEILLGLACMIYFLVAEKKKE